MRAVKESDAVLDQKKKKLNRKVTHINFYQLDLCAQRVCKHNSKKKIHCGKNWKYNPITSRGKKKELLSGRGKDSFSKSFKLGNGTILQWKNTHLKKKNLSNRN